MQSIPALVQVLVIFVLVVVATARKVHLGLAATVGGIALALWRGMTPLAAGRAALAEATSFDTLLLVGLMSGIMAFSAAMKKSGDMEAFSRALGAILPSRRFAMATAPLLIGTLPMPGGAILSAPLVDAMDPERSRGGDVLSAANYWFRHSLELAWPLYPAFILTVSLSGIGTGRLMLLNAYALPLLFVLGLAFILPPSRRLAGGEKADTAARGDLAGRLAEFARGVAPLALVLGIYMLLDAVWRAVAPGIEAPARVKALVGRYGPIYIGLAAGCILVRAGKSGRGAFKGSIGVATFKLVAVIVGIRIFSALLAAAGIAAAAAGELAAAGIPTMVAVAILPFVAGLVTGVGFGYVGLAFPIVLGLVPAGAALPREALIVLAGAYGYAGMMLSPLHVCMVVSAEHFGVGLASTMCRFALPLLIFVLTGTAYALLLTRIL